MEEGGVLSDHGRIGNPHDRINGKDLDFWPASGHQPLFFRHLYRLDRRHSVSRHRANHQSERRQCSRLHRWFYNLLLAYNLGTQDDTFTMQAVMDTQFCWQRRGMHWSVTDNFVAGMLAFDIIGAVFIPAFNGAIEKFSNLIYGTIRFSFSSVSWEPFWAVFGPTIRGDVSGVGTLKRTW